MARFRTYSQTVEPAGAEVPEQVRAQGERLQHRLAAIRHIVIVGSGKGGVGKSALSANLAAALAAAGWRVGAVDADLNGPSLARMLGASTVPLVITPTGVTPALGVAGVRVVSMDLLLAADDSPVRWRDPGGAGFIWQSTLETGAVREFLADVDWGSLDFLIVDAPPGTDKLQRLLTLVARPSAVLLVTTPSETARHVVARSVRLLREAGIPRLGLAANMAGYRCPACGHAEHLFGVDGADRLAEAAGVPLWAEVPFDPAIAASTDVGRPFVLEPIASSAADALRGLALRLLTELREEDP
ncbi:MAG TPA: P-loop NTPase [Longimicrobiales bacterium]|nr:P-loop NTPase [Longimicrobiales bacterium]